jgi:hypothetical protein
MSNKKKPRASKNSPHEPKTTTLSKSWLNGWTDKRALHEPVTLARVYFTGWTEKKVRTLCRELLAVLNRHTIAKTLSPLAVLTHASTALLDDAQMGNLLDKWIDQLILIDTGKVKGRAGSKTYAHSRLVAALMLKAAAEDDVATAVEAERFLLHHGSSASALEQVAPDIKRGRKVIDGAKLGHAIKHGTAEQKNARWEAYRATFNEYRERNKGWSYEELKRKTAAKHGCSTKTISRYCHNPDPTTTKKS